MNSALPKPARAQLYPRIVDGMSSRHRAAAPLARITRSLALFCCLGSLATVLPPTQALFAQQQAQRVVEGKVVNKSGAALKGATVFLKDGHTLSVMSYITSSKGTYRFSRLTQNTDYQVWAEYAGKKSAVKNISSFDSRKAFNITLKIAVAK